MKPSTLVALLAAVTATVALPGLTQAQAVLAKPAQLPSITIEQLPVYVDPKAIPLPHPTIAGPGEQWERFAGDRIVRNVTAPTLTPFLPDPAKATGAAVIVAPGGGYMMLSMDHEGYDVARWLADHGIAAFVLKYRLRPTPRDPQAYLGTLTAFITDLMRKGADSGTVEPTALPVALADAQAAVRLVRARAGEWKIDPSRVGFTGFSAGAMTTLGVGLTTDKASRPDFIAPIYGPMNISRIPADAPPLFTALAADDGIMGRGDLVLIQSYKAANRPFELHIFKRGGHGFGMKTQNRTSDLWIDKFYAWMKDRGLLTGRKRGGL